MRRLDYKNKATNCFRSSGYDTMLSVLRNRFFIQTFTRPLFRELYKKHNRYMYSINYKYCEIITVYLLQIQVYICIN